MLPSPADSELVDERAVALGVLVLEVLEQPSALADQHQEATPRVVVLGVLLEVIGETVDPFRQERDLDLRRPGVARVDAELLDQAPLLVDGQRHGGPPSIATPRGAASVLDGGGSPGRAAWGGVPGAL